MLPGQRGPEREPGDLFLDLAVPADQRVLLVCDGLTVQATHVWTGYGWTRLTAGPVRLVPGQVAVSA